MAAGSYVQLAPFASTPSPPPVGSLLLYIVGTTIYLEDSAGNVYPFGSTSFISALTGDVSATGPGSAVATVNFVGGQSASAVAAATIAVGAATSANTASTLVMRDASGNFAAGTITAALIGNVTGNVSGSSSSFTGSLAGDVTGAQGSTSIASTVVTGKVLTGLTAGTNTAILATDTILVALEKLQAQVSASLSGAITALTGDVSASGPGSAAATVNSVGGKTASDIANAVTAVDAATSANTASTLVERDASGNFSAGTISAALNGNATTSTTSTNFTGSLAGDVTGTQGATVVATVGGKSASDIAAATATVDAATSANTASTLVKRDASGNFAAGTISAALIGNVTGNVSGTASNITGLLAIVNGGTNSAAALANNRIMISAGGAIVEASALTAHRALVTNASGLPAASVTTDTEIGYVSGVTSSIQTQFNTIFGSYITSLTGDGTASGPGAAVFTLTNSAVTGQPVTGFVAGPNSAVTATDTILQALQKLQAQSSASSGSAITQLHGDVTAIGPGNVAATVALVGGQTAAAVAAAAVAVAAATTAATPNTLVLRDGSGNILAANFSGSSSGTNTGDVTETNTNSIDLSITGQDISANLNLSADPADANNIKATTTIHGPTNPGLHIEYPYGTPVNIGTTNAPGSSTSISLADHVHAITWAIIGGLVINTYVIGSNIAIAATDTLVQALGKLQAQINATVGAAITALTGDVTATGPGSVAATISVGAVTDTKASLAAKPAMAVVATTNQALSGLPTIDGRVTLSGDLVLLSAQTTASQNGPWVAASGSWTRPTWFPSGGTTQAVQFSTTLIRLGTIYQGSIWRMTTAGPVTIDTTATTWTITPLSGNFKSTFVVGPQTGSSVVNLEFANSFIGTLAWNPGSNQTITFPPNLVGAGSYLADTGSGVLAWTNPITNIDGGSPTSNYVAAQVINGGTP